MNIKERSLLEDIAPNEIYNDERRKLIERTQSESSELAKHIPTFGIYSRRGESKY